MHLLTKPQWCKIHSLKNQRLGTKNPNMPKKSIKQENITKILVEVSDILSSVHRNILKGLAK